MRSKPKRKKSSLRPSPGAAPRRTPAQAAAPLGSAFSPFRLDTQQFSLEALRYARASPVAPSAPYGSINLSSSKSRASLPFTPLSGDAGLDMDMELDNQDAISPQTAVLEEKIARQARELDQVKAQLEKEKRERARINENLMQREAEDASIRQALSEAERKNSSLQLKLSEVEMSSRNELQRKDLEISKESTKLALLEKRAKTTQSEVQTLQKNLADTEAAAARRQVDMESEILRLKDLNKSLELQLRNASAMGSGSVNESEARHVAHKLEMSEQRVSNLTKENDLLKNEIASFKKRKAVELSEAEEVSSLKSQLSAAQVRLLEVESQVKRGSESAVLLPQLQDDLKRFESQQAEYLQLKRDIMVLRNKQQNDLLLKERINELETTLKRKDSEIETFVKQQIEHERAVERYKQFEQSLSELKEYSSPAQIRRIISDLQATNATLLNKSGELGAELAGLKSRLEALQRDYSELKAKYDDNSRELMIAKELNRTREQSLLVAQTEIQGLKNLLASYDAEDGIQGNFDRQKAERITELEKQIMSLNKLVDSLNADLTSSANQRVDLEKRSAALEREAQTLGSELSVAQSLLGKGHYDPATTKVLHLSTNPVSEAREQNLKAQIAELEEKIRSLEEKIRVLESAPKSFIAATSNILPSRDEQLRLFQEKEKLKADCDKLSGEVQKLTKAAASAEKAKTRFMEVFTKKYQEFAKVARNVFGFNFEVFGEKGDAYKMTPVNGSKDNYFMVRYESSTDTIHMLETAYVHNFDDEINEFLAERSSWPLFFAAVIQKIFGEEGGGGNDEDSVMSDD